MYWRERYKMTKKIQNYFLWKEDFFIRTWAFVTKPMWCYKRRFWHIIRSQSPKRWYCSIIKSLGSYGTFFNTVTNIKTELLMNVFVVCTQVAIFDVLRAERNKNCGNNFCCSRTPPRPFQNSICINQHFYSTQEVQSTLMIFACRI